MLNSQNWMHKYYGLWRGKPREGRERRQEGREERKTGKKKRKRERKKILFILETNIFAINYKLVFIIEEMSNLRN